MTLNIKTGDWAVLREGTVEGPMIVKEDTKHTLYPVETGSTCTRSWTIDGKYYHPSETIAVEDDALDIITTLPCPPLERIRQLEEALRAWEKWEANLIFTGSDKLWNELGDISEIQAIRNAALGESK